MKYIGSTISFKQRHYAHKQSFKDETLKHSTALSGHVWEKGLNPDPQIKWEILATSLNYRKGMKFCPLCLEEKYLIMLNIGNPQYLNKRSELAAKCRHRAKWTLQHAK